jgi:hypothetical protein
MEAREIYSTLSFEFEIRLRKSILKIAVVCSTETSIRTNTARQLHPEKHTVDINHCENLTSYILTKTRRFLLPSYHSLMELSPSWEAANCAATQEFPRILRNPKVNYCVHKSPPLAVSWARSIQSIPSHSISVPSILILSAHLLLGLPSGLFPSDFRTNILYLKQVKSIIKIAEI